jgi:hypothetical protein
MVLAGPFMVLAGPLMVLAPKLRDLLDDGGSPYVCVVNISHVLKVRRNH